MSYFGSRLDRTSDSLNMLFDYNGIDLDVLMCRASNIQCSQNSYKIEPYPNIINGISNIKNLKFSILEDIENIEFPFLLGNINKKIWNRIEHKMYENDINFVLLLGEKDDKYILNDPDIGPYILMSKEKILQGLDRKVVIELQHNIELNYCLYSLYEQNIKNIKPGNSIGSDCYLKIANKIIEKNTTSRDEAVLYYSIINLTNLTYKMLELSKKFENLKLIGFLKEEIAIFDSLIFSLTKKKGINIIYENIMELYINRKEMESACYEYKNTSK